MPGGMHQIGRQPQQERGQGCHRRRPRVEKKRTTRELALKCLARFGSSAPKQPSNALPEVDPEITTYMWDTKKHIKKTAT